MSIQLRYAAFSDVGLVRSNNQDGGYASPHLLVVADGMGGAAAGDIASSVTVGHLVAVDDVHAADDLLPLLRRAVEAAHDDMLALVAENPKMAGMGTTCIAMLRASNKLAMVHIGDSRAYLLRDGKLGQVTHDHTLVQYLVDHGRLTPEEAEHHPQRNVIMRALGDTPGEVELDESVREARVGDRWLLCSDGLFGVVAHDTIEHAMCAIPDLHQLGEHLIDLALAAGAPDNVTVILADVIDDAALTSPLPSQPIVVGSAARDYRRPTRGGNSAAAKAATLTRNANAGAGAGAGAGGAASSDQARSATSSGNSSHSSNPDSSAGEAGSGTGTASGAGTVSGAASGAGRKNKSAKSGPACGAAGRENSGAEGAPRARWGARLAVILTVLALAVAGLFGAYRWTQSRYYVANNNGIVTIYRGIPQRLGPLEFSHAAEATDLQVRDLTPVAQDRLATPITRASLREARAVVAALREQKAQNNEPTPAPASASPAPSAPAVPAPGAPAPAPGQSAPAPEQPAPAANAPAPANPGENR
ncbi:protein phosphatase 2C domain-containing protein [Actinotignum timonense]|uniref:PP2C family protein-serine/threonine phosphatase n=1 Tax=Actinotignum TaxID=1653174 RepID=UPI002549C4B7|nr:protein phosphatase 2C domain-containing protein [Actinotignum timonense]MDK6926688.1 protein phosphatase 2C domain-containing protein [Actinotignum timonense]